VLKVQNISRRFGPMFALADITFTARHGEILGLIGPNGAGKTTLLEILSGMLPADGGSVFWEESLLPAPRRKHVMFYLPEAVTPYPDRRAIDVLVLYAQLLRQPDDRLAGAIEDLALSPILQTRVGALSKGYRRRLLLALALLAPQPLIMIDEPFDGLDLKQTREVMGVLRRLCGADRTLLLSIHQLSDAERLCDRFVLLSGGSVRGEGNLADLRAGTGGGHVDLEEVFLALT
jgi:ABC-2 type transport system ATP-binding protein